MPETRTVEYTVFKFAELTDKAKEKARDWFREGALDHDWWEHTYEDAVQCGAILGIEIAASNQRWSCTDGRSGVDTSPAIFFSGFSSQGDGAQFEGEYSYANGAHKKIRQHAPKDTELHRIADELFALQRANAYDLLAKMDCKGAQYNHSGWMNVDVVLNNRVTRHSTDEWTAIDKALTQLMRDFANWIYKQLNAEYDYQMSDEVVDDNISANEYEFNEDGTRARF